VLHDSQYDSRNVCYVCLAHSCVTSYSYVLRCVTRRIRLCDKICRRVTRLCDMTFVCVTRLIRMRYMTYLYLPRDPFICVACLTTRSAIEWRRQTGQLIFAGHLSQKSPRISGYFTDRYLKNKPSHESSPLCAVLHRCLACIVCFECVQSSLECM